MSAPKQKIKILVADDHPVVRKGLQSCLAREERLRVVGEASDGDEALRLTRELPKIKVLVLSVHSNKEYIFRIIQAGAHGYVSKEAPPEELLRAIECVHNGEPFFSPEIARAALNQLVNNGGKKDPFAQLTSREREVLALIAEGRSNKEIASDLGIGVRTIETHRERIMRRLEIHSVAGLTKFAIAHGIVTLDGTSRK